MRTISVNTFTSLDGVMQAPGGPAEDPTGGFAFGGWGASGWDEGMDEAVAGWLGGDLLLGRRTYEIFAAHWAYVEDDTAAAINGATKYVVSRTLQDPTWSGTVVLPDVDAVAALKQGDGPDLQVHGSSDLLQSLLAADLVDELRVWTWPVVLGGGKRLFEGGARPGGWALVESRTSSTGVVIATYRRTGDVPIGDFQLEEPTELELQRRANLT